jgi:hypothetical protein
VEPNAATNLPASAATQGNEPVAENIPDGHELVTEPNKSALYANVGIGRPSLKMSKVSSTHLNSKGFTASTGVTAAIFQLEEKSPTAEMVAFETTPV